MEAAAALLRVHELSFARARQLDEPETYDAFVALFPDARQVPKAIEAAYRAEKRSIEAESEGGLFDLRARFYADEHRARIARRLFNEARRAEKAGRRLTADRKYRLLELPLFADSEAVTEHLDRDERLAWQQGQRQAAQRSEAVLRERGGGFGVRNGVARVQPGEPRHSPTTREKSVLCTCSVYSESAVAGSKLWARSSEQ